MNPEIESRIEVQNRNQDKDQIEIRIGIRIVPGQSQNRSRIVRDRTGQCPMKPYRIEPYGLNCR
jgi:hypothetical protein